MHIEKCHKNLSRSAIGKKGIYRKMLKIIISYTQHVGAISITDAFVKH